MYPYSKVYTRYRWSDIWEIKLMNANVSDLFGNSFRANDKLLPFLTSNQINQTVLSLSETMHDLCGKRTPTLSLFSDILTRKLILSVFVFCLHISKNICGSRMNSCMILISLHEGTIYSQHWLVKQHLLCHPLADF